jgi:hypothetical protein
VTVAWLLPPTIIIAPLSLLGLLAAIMREMAGVRPTADPGEIPGFGAALIAYASWLALPVLIAIYVREIIAHRRRQAP